MFSTSNIRKLEELSSVLDWFEQVVNVRNTLTDENTRLRFEHVVMHELQSNIKTNFTNSPYATLVEFSNLLGAQTFVDLHEKLLQFKHVVVSLEPLLLSIELRLNQKSVVHD